MRKYKVTGHSPSVPPFHLVHVKEIGGDDHGGFNCLEPNLPAVGETVEIENLGAPDSKVYWRGHQIGPHTTGDVRP